MHLASGLIETNGTRFTAFLSGNRDLRDCALVDIPSGVFDALTNLTQLWLDGNRLQEISHALFGKLAQLETL